MHTSSVASSEERDVQMSDAMALEPSGAKRNVNPNLKDGGLVLEKAAHAHAHAHRRERAHHHHSHAHYPQSGEDLARALAMQFYKIELGEQRRLMGVMEHHSKESTTVPASVQSQSYAQVQGTISESDEERTEEEDNGDRDGGDREREREREEEAFPFSITAGVEKGEKNRCVFRLVYLRCR